MSEERLNVNCMLSLHRKLVNNLGDSFTELVLSRFAENPRKLLLKLIEGKNWEKTRNFNI